MKTVQWKARRTFIENRPEQWGVYAPSADPRRFNGELLALCEDEKTAERIAAIPDLASALKYFLAARKDGGKLALAMAADVAEEALRKAGFEA